MNTQIKDLPKSQVELTITVGPDEYQVFLEKAAKRLAQSSKIAGFRPDKVPYEISKKQFGEDNIMKEAVLDIVNKTLTDVIKQEGLFDFIGRPDLNIKTMEPGKDLVYQATIMLIPKVIIPSLDGITIKKKKVEIDQKEVDHALAHLARSRAKEILKPDHEPAVETDMVDIDYELSLDGKKQEDQIQKGFKLYLGDSHMIPGFEEQIVGLKRGGQKTFKITFPESYWQSDYQNKEAEFQVKVNNVYQVEKPEITDEFAKTLGDFKSAEDLTNKIKANLKLEKDTENTKQLENEMFDEVIKAAQFDEFPDQLINDEVERIFGEFKLMLQSKGSDIETWFKNMNKKEEDFRKDIRPQAETRIKTNLVIREVVKTENMEPDMVKVDSEIKKLLEIYRDNQEMLERISSDQYKEYLASGLVTQDAIKWLRGKVVEE